MWSVERPQFDAGETFSTCVSRIRNSDLKNRLLAVSDDIVREAAAYASRAQTAELHLMLQQTDVSGLVSVDEMVDVYEQRMAGKKGPARHIYDAIKLLPRYGICPFCDHRPVSTLDHVLPKKLFPALAVVPDNLVGACGDCNRVKLAFVASTADEVLFHPYFDNAADRRWLAAQVVEGPVAAVVFRTQNVSSWPNSLNRRVRQHFRMLRLGQLYGDQAAREIGDQAQALGAIHDARGAEGVREELIRQTQTRETARLNSWQAATYRALSESTWFCDGGFRGS